MFCDDLTAYLEANGGCARDKEVTRQFSNVLKQLGKSEFKKALAQVARIKEIDGENWVVLRNARPGVSSATKDTPADKDKVAAPAQISVDIEPNWLQDVLSCIDHSSLDVLKECSSSDEQSQSSGKQVSGSSGTADERDSVTGRAGDSRRTSTRLRAYASGDATPNPIVAGIRSAQSKEPRGQRTSSPAASPVRAAAPKANPILAGIEAAKPALKPPGADVPTAAPQPTFNTTDSAPSELSSSAADDAVNVSVRERAAAINHFAATAQRTPELAAKPTNGDSDSLSDDVDVDKPTPLDEEEKQFFALCAACYADDNWFRVMKMLEHRPQLARRKDGVQMTALHWAAKFGMAELLKVIAGGYKADVNATSFGQTPLHYAAMNQHNECFDVLRRVYKADDSLRDYQGKKADFYLLDQNSRASIMSGRISATSMMPMSRETLEFYQQFYAVNEPVERPFQALVHGIVDAAVSPANQPFNRGSTPATTSITRSTYSLASHRSTTSTPQGLGHSRSMHSIQSPNVALTASDSHPSLSSVAAVQ